MERFGFGGGRKSQPVRNVLALHCDRTLELHWILIGKMSPTSRIVAIAPADQT
ncbi:MAG: hypothetical protein ACP5D7_19145 [Limnospira sp.]